MTSQKGGVRFAEVEEEAHNELQSSTVSESSGEEEDPQPTVQTASRKYRSFLQFGSSLTGQNGGNAESQRSARTRKSLGAFMYSKSSKQLATISKRKTIGGAQTVSTGASNPTETEGAHESRVSRSASVKVLKGRPRSLSRGPRRGRDRFRGIGNFFSTSSKRLPARPPRTVAVESIPEGTSSRIVLTLLRSRRAMSPSPTRIPIDRRDDLLKYKSEDAGHNPQDETTD